MLQYYTLKLVRSYNAAEQLQSSAAASGAAAMNQLAARNGSGTVNAKTIELAAMVISAIPMIVLYPRFFEIFFMRSACRDQSGVEIWVHTAADLRRISRGIFYENKRRNDNRILWRFPPKRGQDPQSSADRLSAYVRLSDTEENRSLFENISDIIRIHGYKFSNLFQGDIFLIMFGNIGSCSIPLENRPPVPQE